MKRSDWWDAISWQSCHLSRVQACILALAAKGHANTDIARTMWLDYGTVANQITNALDTFGAEPPRGRTRAVLEAIGRGYFRYGGAGNSGPDVASLSDQEIIQVMVGRLPAPRQQTTEGQR